MASFGPNAQRRYAPLTSSSTANLVPPSARKELQPQPQSGLNVPFVPLSKGPPSLRSMKSNSSLSNGGTDSQRVSSAMSTSEKFAFASDPFSWGTDMSNRPEADDVLHNPDPRRDHKRDNATGSVFTWRGMSNLGCLLVLFLSLVGLFAGYPITTFIISLSHRPSYMDGFNFGGINSSGQIPDIGNWGLIDVDTPLNVHTRPSYVPGKPDMQLVFSDEFNTDGRSFYPGDDPFWTAEDLHYWQTGNLEWYDPGAITTRGGNLEITLTRRETQGLKYQGGMMSSWNKFCFTGGIIETSVSLPGSTNIMGLWPAVWTMGNLGRAGYGASLEGLWPYSYDSCDVGTVKNQTLKGQPIAATQGGTDPGDSSLSFLPGQKLSRCTCPGESHPGPMHNDGTFVGRSAPEIDIFEAQVNEKDLYGQVSQSAQWAPFNNAYQWNQDNSSQSVEDFEVTTLNAYLGAVFQQTTSALSKTNQDCYEFSGTGCFTTFAFQYQPGFADAYIAWVNDGKLAWQHNAQAVGPDSITEIEGRPIPQEPMYIIANLGMSPSFGPVEEDKLVFPSTMKVDWIRVYQDPDRINVGCDPVEFPTAAYIEEYMEAYTNPLLTTWKDDFKKPFPKNKLLDEC